MLGNLFAIYINYCCSTFTSTFFHSLLDSFAMQTTQLIWLHMLLFMCLCIDPLSGLNATAAKANVGIILDLDGTVGKICKTCISMAIEDFYSNRDYSTMIEPHFRDSRSDVVTAASAGILTFRIQREVFIFFHGILCSVV